MTVVNPKSISGINSITMASGGDDLLTIHNNNGTERFRVQSDKVMSSLDFKPDGNNTRDLGASGTKWKDAYIGTLRADVGVVTAFSGDLNIDDKIVHTGDTNTAIRFPAADTVTVETGGVQRLRIDSTGDVRFTGTNLTDSTNKNVNLTVPSYDTDEEDVNIIQVENESSTNQISFGGGTSGLNAATKIRFLTASAANTVTGTERFSIASDGDVTVGTGNLVIGTSGKGIDFSATGDGSGASNVSELLDDYEEGTFSPTYGASNGTSTTTYTNQQGSYTKIGNTVFFNVYIRINSISTSSHSVIVIGNLPFTNAGNRVSIHSIRSGGFQGTGNDSRPFAGTVEQSQTRLELVKATDGGTTDFTTSTSQSNSQVYIAGQYPIS